MAGGEKLGPVEAGFLDTPTFNLALLLFFMLAFSMLFESSTKRLKLYLRRRKRNGLAQAVTNLVRSGCMPSFLPANLLRSLRLPRK